MALNPEIISEISNAAGVDEKVKSFLLWAVNFEKDNLEMDQPRFKKEYGSKLDVLLPESSEISETTNDEKLKND